MTALVVALWAIGCGSGEQAAPDTGPARAQTAAPSIATAPATEPGPVAYFLA